MRRWAVEGLRGDVDDGSAEPEQDQGLGWTGLDWTGGTRVLNFYQRGSAWARRWGRVIGGGLAAPTTLALSGPVWSVWPVFVSLRGAKDMTWLGAVSTLPSCARYTLLPKYSPLCWDVARRSAAAEPPPPSASSSSLSSSLSPSPRSSAHVHVDARGRCCHAAVPAIMQCTLSTRDRYGSRSGCPASMAIWPGLSLRDVQRVVHCTREEPTGRGSLPHWLTTSLAHWSCDRFLHHHRRRRRRRCRCCQLTSDPPPSLPHCPTLPPRHVLGLMRPPWDFRPLCIHPPKPPRRMGGHAQQQFQPMSLHNAG